MDKRGKPKIAPCTTRGLSERFLSRSRREEGEDVDVVGSGASDSGRPYVYAVRGYLGYCSFEVWIERRYSM
jgi:hypothetical protein